MFSLIETKEFVEQKISDFWQLFIALETAFHSIDGSHPSPAGGGGTRSGFIRGCAAPGSEPLPYFRESRTPKTYPILGKFDKITPYFREIWQNHTLF